MPAADLPVDEQERLQNLYSYELLDTLPEKDYDDITKLASHICDTPVSLVTLVDKDRQWFKSAYGTNLQQTEREYAFCAHAILEPTEIMIVPNAEKDARFADNPLVTGEHKVMFYAGVPLLSEEGFPIGSLCVIDNKPKELNESQQQALKILANQTIRLMLLHKRSKELTHSRQLLQEINKELETFAQTAAENLRKPLDNAIEISDLIAEKFDTALDNDGKQLLSLIKYSCENIKTTVDETLQRAERLNFLQDIKTIFTFTGLVQELKQQALLSSAKVVLGYEPINENIYFFKSLLLQVINNIISASVAFNNKEQLAIQITYYQSRYYYVFTIIDNGNGLPVFSSNGNFILFKDSNENKQQANEYLRSLTEIRHLITMLSGKLEMNFEEDKGTHFIISVPK